MNKSSKMSKNTKNNEKLQILMFLRYFMIFRFFSIFDLFVGRYPRYIGIEGRAKIRQIGSGKESFLGADNFSIGSDSFYVVEID